MKGMGCSLFKPDLSTRRPRRLSAHGAATHPREYVGTQPNLKSLSNYPKACFQASMTLSIGAHCKRSHAFPLPVLLHQALADDGRVGSPSPLIYVPPSSLLTLSQVSALWRCWHFSQQSCSIALLSTKPERGGNELLSSACPLSAASRSRVLIKHRYVLSGLKGLE